MNDADWIDAKTACATLGVKPQTLYAYVSRHKIRVKADPADARTSIYSRIDIETLLRQSRRPRAREDVAQAAIRWGDAIMPTSISEVRDGTIWLRGHAIETCAETMSLEEVTAVLCGFDRVHCPATDVCVAGTTTFTRAMKVLAQETETAPPMQTLDPVQVAEDVGRVMSLISDACLDQPLAGPIHERVATAWGISGEALDIVRRALVLMSDHELNPSTFAVRICASTGASLPAALLSGMATLSGPRHGGVAVLSMGALKAAGDGRFDAFLEENARLDPYVFGFGHPLYPNGDPRADHLLRRIPSEAPVRKTVTKLSARLNRPPNIDAALAAIALHFGLPAEAPMTIFSIGRVAGWTAHAMEQVASGAIIRPRAKYQPKPVAETP